MKQIVNVCGAKIKNIAEELPYIVPVIEVDWANSENGNRCVTNIKSLNLMMGETNMLDDIPNVGVVEE